MKDTKLIPLTAEELTAAESGLVPDQVLGRMVAEIRAHRQTMIHAEGLTDSIHVLDDENLTILHVVIADEVHQRVLQRTRGIRLDANEHQLIVAGQKLQCIAALRKRTGLSLLDCKQLVEHQMRKILQVRP